MKELTKAVNDYNEFELINDKINSLRKLKSNILVKSYVNLLIHNLYISIDSHKNGFATEMINNMNLENYPYESTESIIPFFKSSDEIIRGIINIDNNLALNHSWINFNLKNNEYILDPSLNLIVSKELYNKVFNPTIVAHIKRDIVKESILDTLTYHKLASDMFILKGSSDIKSPFYKNDMYVKGETINKKILTLTTKFNNKNN